MLHIVKLVERRFPNHNAAIVTGLLVFSAAALAIGLWLWLAP
jgi:hypothetical protein